VVGKLAEVRGKDNNLTFSEVYNQQLTSDTDVRLGCSAIERKTITRFVYETREKKAAEEYFVGEERSDEQWVKDMFSSHQAYRGEDIRTFDWSAVVEAAIKIKADATFLVLEGGFLWMNFAKFGMYHLLRRGGIATFCYCFCLILVV
jgi:hypothetical protein